MSKLLPCPFCGKSENVHLETDFHPARSKCNWSARVVCLDCFGTAQTHGFEWTEENAKRRAVTAWNRRTEPDTGYPATDRKPLTLDELREMEGEPVYIFVLDKTVFADKDDAIDGWGLIRKSWVRLWDKGRADIVKIDHDFEDYGKIWLAYRHKPKEAT